MTPKLLAVFLFLCSAALIALFWSWQGAPVAMPASPLIEGSRLPCMSYTPYRGTQSPLASGATIELDDIEDDLARLAKVTACIRTYSAIPRGADIAEIAERQGLKVLQGIWLSRDAVSNAAEIDAGLAIAKRFPNTLRGIIVGNEVLLRGEMTATDLAATVKKVNDATDVPVTYADVWEFWLRNANVANAADFATIHILPFWEDLPVAEAEASAHVSAIYAKVHTAFPGKKLLVGEVGWPSTGRMREAALPSPSAQARVIHDVLAVARRDNIDVNIIESFDQPWKRTLEGTVGGHWGILDAATRAPKFTWGAPVSDHPHWRWHAAIGIALSLLVFAAAWLTSSATAPLTTTWVLATFVIATIAGAMIGWTLERVPVESFYPAGWLRNTLLAALALLVPPLAAAMGPRLPLQGFATALNKLEQSQAGWLARLAAVALALTFVVAADVALGLVFDPRYRDFPFAPLTAIAAGLTAVALLNRARGPVGLAELAAAGLIVLTVLYIVPNETLANWQSLWTCSALLLVAWTFTQARAARS